MMVDLKQHTVVSPTNSARGNGGSHLVPPSPRLKLEPLKINRRLSMSTVASTNDLFGSGSTYVAADSTQGCLTPRTDMTSALERPKCENLESYRIRYALDHDRHHLVFKLHPDLPPKYRGYGTPIRFSSWGPVSRLIAEGYWAL